MISLEQLKKLLYYQPETGNFIRLINRRKYKAGEVAGFLNVDGYVCIEINGKTYFASRLAWFYMTGEWPKDEIDHKDTIKTNNQWENLREATHTNNLRNTNVYSNNMLGIKGIRCKESGFEARIRVNKKLIYLGFYYDINKAKAAYNFAAKWYFGEFARF